MELHPGEHVIYEGHPSWRSTFGFYFMGVVIVAAVIAIGVAHPFSVLVETFGTEAAGVSPTRIEELVRQHFDLRPAAILRDLDLRRPIYQKTAAYGHFGRDDHDFTWERTDKADALRAAAGVNEPVRVPG